MRGRILRELEDEREADAYYSAFTRFTEQLKNVPGMVKQSVKSNPTNSGLREWTYSYEYEGHASLLFGCDTFSYCVRWLNCFVQEEARRTSLFRRLFRKVFEVAELARASVILYARPFTLKNPRPHFDLNSIESHDAVIFSDSKEDRAKMIRAYKLLCPSLIEVPFQGKRVLKYSVE